MYIWTCKTGCLFRMSPVVTQANACFLVMNVGKKVTKNAFKIFLASGMDALKIQNSVPSLSFSLVAKSYEKCFQ